MTSARRMYTGHLGLFLGIGLLFIPLGLVITSVQYLLFRLGRLAPLVDSAGASNGIVDTLALVLGILITLIGLAIVHTTTALAMVELEQGRDITVRSAFRLALRRFPTVIGALVVAAVIVAAFALTTIGLLISAWLIVHWGLVAQTVALENEGIRGSLRRSGQLVRNNWWRAASLTLFVTFIGLVLGPLTGTLLLFMTSASFDFVNLVSSLVFVITLPFVAIATTYLYFDLAARQSEAEAAETVPVRA